MQTLLYAALVDTLSSSCPSVPILTERNLTQLSKFSSPLAADLSLTCPTVPVLKGPHSPPDGLPKLPRADLSMACPSKPVLTEQQSKGKDADNNQTDLRQLFPSAHLEPLSKLKVGVCICV
eukprot:g36915.t1